MKLTSSENTKQHKFEAVSFIYTKKYFIGAYFLTTLTVILKVLHYRFCFFNFSDLIWLSTRVAYLSYKMVTQQNSSVCLLHQHIVWIELRRKGKSCSVTKLITLYRYFISICEKSSVPGFYLFLPYCS